MIYSTTHISSNEDGQEEVQIDRDMTLGEVLAKAWQLKSFNFPKRLVEKFVRIGERYGVYAEKTQVWVFKGTNKEVGDEKHIQILKVQIQTSLERLREGR